MNDKGLKTDSLVIRPIPRIPWLLSDANFPEKAKRLINAPRAMIMIFWNPLSIHVFDSLPAGIYLMQHTSLIMF
jgi:hypothetical protein